MSHGLSSLLWRSIYTYSWDLVERGIDNACAEISELGQNTNTIAGSYHAGKFLRPRSSSPVLFPEDGTVYFRHDPSRYGSIRPEPNSLVAERDILAELCSQSQLSVNVWLVLLHNTLLGSRYPQSCVQNAFGDRYIYNLCPSSPHARAYACGLAADVAANYEVTGISMESPGFAPFIHGFHHEFNLVQSNRWLENLLGLCFCEHCRTGAVHAGIDASGLQRRVKEQVTRYLSGSIDYPADMAESFWLADVATDQELGAFLSWRCEVVSSLVSDIRSQVHRDISLAVIPSVARPTANAWYEGSDLAALRKAAGVLEICLYEPSAQRAAADFDDVCGRIGGSAGMRCILRPSHPDLNSAAEVRAVAEYVGAGDAQGISFYNWGFLRPHNLQFIAEALREFLA